MRRLLLCAALLVALAVPAQAAVGSETGTLRGAVYNTTCYGPCRYPPPPPPLYTGDNLVVKVRGLPDGKPAATLHPKDGRFRINLRPGIYRVRALVKDGGPCWEGSAKKVKVAKGETTRVRLSVHNACIR